MAEARGGFEVTMKADPHADSAEGTVLGSMVVKKRFHGDLVASGRGRMLTGMTAVEGSAGYVLLERVKGRLDGRAGSFLLQHFGILDRGVPRQTIEVVPDSGTGELEGLRGRMTIRVVGGVHSYKLEYRLPAPSRRARRPASTTYRRRKG
jgi:hypothetical protein